MKTIEDKLKEAPPSDFIESLRSQFKEKGFLSAKQENVLDEILEHRFSKQQSRKQYKYEDKDPESFEDLLL